MQRGGREKGAKKLSKKEKEKIEKAKEEEQRKKEEEKQRRREEKLLGIKPDRNEKKEIKEEKNEDTEKIEETEKKMKNNKTTKKSKEQKRNERNEKKAEKLRKEEEALNQKVEQTLIEPSSEKVQLEVIEEEVSTVVKEEIHESNALEEFDTENEVKEKKVKKNKPVELEIKERNGKINLKGLPKEIRKKNIINEEEKLEMLKQYFEQWNEQVNMDYYPFNHLSAADNKDLNQILNQISASKRKNYLKQYKNDSSFSLGKLFYIEALSLSTETVQFTEEEIDIHLIYLFIQHEVYKVYSLVLVHQQSLSKFDLTLHKQIIEKLLSAIKKIKSPQAVSLKAFQAAYTLQIDSTPLKEYYVELVEVPNLLKGKVPPKIFEFGLSESVDLAAQMLVIDPLAFRSWDDYVLNNLKHSEQLLQIVKTYQTDELKLFCSRMIETYSNNPKLSKFLRECSSIVNPMSVLKLVGITMTIVICVAAIAYVSIFSN
ncbi:hypothetical protein EDI_276490 [Entamoeba dispar SAW760]|uniref:Transmembrane protein n=1 Tax=Entamoeba dispar (strain ATCC PRA-260 / SAW760) TaxID=370354 RepID=B0EDQ6_ENTDS|nr:uncharacterized protein EDI_276490 [Entamoeba dispar SAW760]EDR27338.1 hypothetical protein EDI_276490 [Entamoeba dispar SAW760]|eukprot:EDR27338.1 hypothetical protein EDI_276490 [Entamoeba dispar SAW760]